MSVDVSITNRGFALVIKHAQGLEANILQAAARGLALGLEAAVSRAQLGYLSGPRPQKLGVRTGRLIKSINQQVTGDPQRVTGVIGTNVKYAAFHEFGFTGTISVKGHKRIVKVMHKGKEIEPRRKLFDRTGKFIGWRDSSRARRLRTGEVKADWIMTQEVKPHTRNVRYAGRPFIRPALQDEMPTIVRMVNAELAKI